MAADRPEEAIGWCRKAMALQPEEPHYAFTLAYFLKQQGEKAEAISILQPVVEKYLNYQEPQRLLKKISSQAFQRSTSSAMRESISILMLGLHGHGCEPLFMSFRPCPDGYR